MAEVKTEDVLQLMGQFILGLNSRSTTKNWTQYGGANNSQANTVVSRARAQVLNFTNQIPLIGPLLGPIAADYLVGDDFKRGVLHNTLSGLMAPQTGTYAGTWQNMWNRQTISMLRTSRDQIKDDLRTDFLTNYYSITTGKEGEELKKLVENAGPLSLPSTLNYLIDPASNRKIIQSIKEAQAGALSWNQRNHPFRHFGLEGDSVSNEELAGRLGTRIAEMAKEANRYALGKGTGTDHYGGFVGAQVSQLASILSNAAQQLNPQSESKLKESLDKFQQRVKETARALAPLKDIFGRDVKAMTDMLQAVTGQSIAQLTPDMIRSLSTYTADMSRYSGASAAQMAQAGQSMLALSANMGGTTFSRIGVGTLGGYYLSLMSAGNTPAGVHAAQYSASTKRALASAQSSQGSDLAAMAYGLWKKNNGKGTFQDFLSEVSNKRTNHPDMVSALVATAGVSSVQGLLAGKGTAQYREALQNPNLAKLGIEEQYRQHLTDTIVGLSIQNPNIGAQQWNALLSTMSNKGNAADIHRLVTDTSKENVKWFATKYKLSEDVVNRFLNSSGSLQYTARWSGQEHIKEYQRAQDKIRQLMKDVQGSNGGDFYTLFKSLSEKSDNLENWRHGKITIRDSALTFLMRGVLGTDNQDEIKIRMKNLKAIYGSDAKVADVLAMASDKIAKDPKLAENIQELSKLGKFDSNWEEDKKKKWESAFKYVTYSQLGLKPNQGFKNNTAKKVEAQAFAKYREAMTTAKSDEDKKTAQENLRKSLQNAARVQKAGNISSANDTQKKAFIKLMEASEGAGFATKDVFKEKMKALGIAEGDLSFEKFQSLYKETGAGYDLQTETNRALKTVAQLAIQWFKKHL